MSEQIKYEAVFGDQTLFDDADPDVVLVETNGVYRTFHKESDSRPYNIASVSRSDLAMRRIIKTPVWRKEDKEDGRLPEVGCAVMVGPETKAIITAYDSIQKVFAVQCEDESLDILKIHEMLPIESPEERANRVREEWCSSANMLISKDKDDRAESAVIYDALLSGELKMPEVQK